MPSSIANVRVPTASSSARSCETSRTLPVEPAQRVLERLARVDVQVVRGLVEDQHVRARRHQDRERQPPALAARQPVERLLGLLAAEQEAAEQGARLVRRELRGALRRLERGPGWSRAPRRAARGSRSARCGRCGACRRRARGGRRAPRSASSCRRRSGPRATRARRARATARRPRASVRPGHLEPAVGQLEHHAPGALGAAEAEPERAVVRRGRARSAPSSRAS